MLRCQAMPQVVMKGALDVNFLAAGIVAVGVPIGEPANSVLGEARSGLCAVLPLANRYTVTKPVVTGFVRRSNRYIIIACNGLKTAGSAHFISICSGVTI